MYRFKEVIIGGTLEEVYMALSDLIATECKGYRCVHRP